MRITIRYEAVWQNSFLDGSNNKSLPKNGRGFVGSIKTLKERNSDGKYSNFIKREISCDTIMGVLNRLIGDQRKLYQARQCKKYFFADIEKNIEIRNELLPVYNEEIVYVRNITGSKDQNSFAGLIKNNDPIFNSDYSDEFWGVLNLDFENLCKFIINKDYKITKNQRLDPLTICEKFEQLNRLKPIKISGYIEQALLELKKNFLEEDYQLKNKEGIKPVAFYCSALYLQISRLKHLHSNLLNSLTKNAGISGISKKNFTLKDFMKRYATGGQKMIWGNPYMLKEKRKGEGEVTSMLTKANGAIEILLNISQEKALLLKEMIENAGVSSFYLGKKGLAYVESIRV